MSFEKKNFGQFLLTLFPQINEDDIMAAINEQINASEEIRKKLGDILVEHNKISAEERDEALQHYEEGFKE